ncbi:MAG TPA: AbrB/MazE/SpoVT family DNA-binding domain-containing protein [Candidatus Nanoarchaeia archaeon]|nr:AbrB/MazE/SpoVT family DNA-binding domain-containing protein [Candidatus Nanoarchaeia archaeon]
MKCVICGGNTQRKNVEHKEFGISLGMFKADVCEKCGEAYFDEKTADEIQRRSREKGLFGLAKKAKVAEVGNSIAIRIPKEIATFMKIKKGKEVTLFPESQHDLRVQV